MKEKNHVWSTLCSSLVIEVCTSEYWQQLRLSDSMSGTGPREYTGSDPLHVKGGQTQSP